MKRSLTVRKLRDGLSAGNLAIQLVETLTGYSTSSQGAPPEAGIPPFDAETDDSPLASLSDRH